METLQSLLAESRLKLRSYRAGHTENGLLCPKCGGGRSKEKSLNVTVDEDGKGFTWLCHRGSCSDRGGKRISSHTQVGPRERPTAYTRPRPHPVVEPSAAVYEWFEKRGISWDTVDAFGVYMLPNFKFGNQGAADALVFPYKYRGELVNRKFRGLHDKRLMLQDAQAEPTLFNIDAVTAPDWMAFCEGEPDVMAMHEAGYPQTVSLKDGSDKHAKEDQDPDAKRFLALSTHADLLKDVKKIVLAGDMDVPGQVLMQEIARRLGRHRCWLVTWPHDCKDANETLLKHGVEWVRKCVEEAKQFPIEDVQEVTGERLDAYLEMPPPPVLSTGILSVDKVLKLPGEGKIIIITGFPNGGKSSFTMNVMVHLMRTFKRRWLVFSPEMQPFDEFAVQVAQILVGKPARRMASHHYATPMSREERKSAGDWFTSRMRFLSSDAQNKIPNLDWILQKTEECVLRFGTTDLLIDPWNKLESSRGNISETEYIGQCLQRCASFGHRHGCNIWIIAHPQKIRPEKPGQTLPPPGPYDINGSANWYNAADIGITIHTPDNMTEVLVWKARFLRWGRKGKKAVMAYDEETGRYHSPEDDAPNVALFSRQTGY